MPRLWIIIKSILSEIINKLLLKWKQLDENCPNKCDSKTTRNYEGY